MTDGNKNKKNAEFDPVAHQARFDAYQKRAQATLKRLAPQLSEIVNQLELERIS